MAPSNDQDVRRQRAYVKSLGKSAPAATAPSIPLKPNNQTLIKTTVDDNYRKTAKILILIGKAAAAKIMARLDGEQVERLSQEIAAVQKIDDAEASILLTEFHARLAGSIALSGGLPSSGLPDGGARSGGVDVARAVLASAFGKERGEALLKKAVPEAAGRPFDFLEDLEGDQIVFLLKDEAPMTAALVLSRLTAKTAAAAIALWDIDGRPEILKRIAKLGTVAPVVLEQVAAALRDKARELGRPGGTERLDGKAALAEILKRSGVAVGGRLLDELSDDDPELGRELKDRLYNLDDIVKVEDRSLQERLRAMSDKDIALLLKGLKAEPAAKLLGNLSSPRRTAVQEEREIMGAVPRRDVDAVVDDFMAWFRQGREAGRILLVDDEDMLV